MQEASARGGEHFRTMGDVSSIGLFQADAQGGCTYVNRYWGELAGITLEAALGKGWLRAVHPDDRKRVSLIWYKSVYFGEKFALEYRFLRPNGHAIWIIEHAVPLNDMSGNVIGYVGTCSDITENKKIETKLHASEKKYKEFLATINNIMKNFDSEANGLKDALLELLRSHEQNG